MIEPTLLSLAQVLLPSEVLDYFDITKVESVPTEIRIHLDEKMYSSLKDDIHFESKGFIAAEGTRYSREFAAFLKETYGHIPGDLPYA